MPYRKLVEAGYEPVIANPKGDMPVIDKNSNNKMFFGGDDAAREAALKYAQGITQLHHPKTLASVVSEGTEGYVGLFIPGGHAPMEDLLRDQNLGKILVSFHNSVARPAIICHGPIVLLSTLSDPISKVVWVRPGSPRKSRGRSHRACWSSSRRLGRVVSGAAAD